MDAKVDIREEFTVLTPGGGEMYDNGTARGGTALYPITAEIGNYRVRVFHALDHAVEAAEQLNDALRANGIDDRSYTVVRRTVTTVVSDWS